jgi:hypothetical protein
MTHVRSALIAACALSGAVHAALAPSHLEESALLAALFLLASVALGALAFVLALRPESAWPPRAASAFFLALIVAYAVTRVSEPIDGLGLATKAVEAVGLVLGLWLRPGRRPLGSSVAIGVAVAAVLAFAVAGMSGGHGHHDDAAQPVHAHE